ncbi:uncharacterized protein [Miscanthus floridulus]|uniref:uncharacterized protein n=1 Tax=Miscanthus floridulus TaxID=154761 RepID=UPI00345ABE5E
MPRLARAAHGHRRLHPLPLPAAVARAVPAVPWPHRARPHPPCRPPSPASAAPAVPSSVAPPPAPAPATPGRATVGPARRPDPRPVSAATPSSDRGQMMMGLSIAPTPMREDWRPTLQHAVSSGGESRVAAVGPSLLGAAPLGLVASTMIATAMVLVVIPVVMAEAMSEVSLAAPPLPGEVEEERENGLPASPGGGPHGSPSWLELEVPRRDVAGPEPECLPVAHEIEVVEIPSDGEVGDEVELPVPL